MNKRNDVPIGTNPRGTPRERLTQRILDSGQLGVHVQNEQQARMAIKLLKERRRRLQKQRRDLQEQRADVENQIELTSQAIQEVELLFPVANKP